MSTVILKQLFAKECVQSTEHSDENHTHDEASPMYQWYRDRRLADRSQPHGQ